MKRCGLFCVEPFENSLYSDLYGTKTRLSRDRCISSKHIGFPSNVNNLLSYENVSVCEYVNFITEDKPCSNVLITN